MIKKLKDQWEQKKLAQRDQLQKIYMSECDGIQDVIFGKLFENLPPLEVQTDYPEQCQLLQICNLALLDEAKRLENENREAKLRMHLMVKKRGIDPARLFGESGISNQTMLSSLVTNAREPDFLQVTDVSHHKPTHVFAYETNGGASNVLQQQAQ